MGTPMFRLVLAVPAVKFTPAYTLVAIAVPSTTPTTRVAAVGILDTATEIVGAVSACPPGAIKKQGAPQPETKLSQRLQVY